MSERPRKTARRLPACCVEVVDNTGRVLTDALSNAIGNVSLRLPAPPLYIVRSTDANGTVRETWVGARSGVNLEHIVNPPLHADTHNQKAVNS